MESGPHSTDVAGVWCQAWFHPPYPTAPPFPSSLKPWQAWLVWGIIYAVLKGPPCNLGFLQPVGLMGGTGPDCAPMSCAMPSSVSHIHHDHRSNGFGDKTSLGMWVLVRVLVRGDGRGKGAGSATVINSVCAHPLCASEEFITATLCAPGRDYVDNALKPEDGRAGCPMRMQGCTSRLYQPHGNLVAAGPAAGGDEFGTQCCTEEGCWPQTLCRHPAEPESGNVGGKWGAKGQKHSKGTPGLVQSNGGTLRWERGSLGLCWGEGQG